jgi:inosine/xanthosine triphosphate pyrophosphatase family protein
MNTNAITHSRQFFSALGNDGLNNLLAAYEDKSATAVCTLAFSAGPGAEPILFQGRVLGTIVSPRGSQGFGKFYQPIATFVARPRNLD